QKTTLDDAFIALLPPEKRAQHQEVIVRPRTISADETPAIEADGLTRRFGNFVAVDHVSFRIARGEIFGFLGSNGSGKTTTMKMLTGLLPVSEGLGQTFWKADGRRRHGGAAQRRLHDAGVFPLQRAHRPAESRPACASLPSAGKRGRRPDQGTARALRSEGRGGREAGKLAVRRQAAVAARR